MQRKIVFDLLNIDNGEIFAIKAAKKFSEENPNYSLILVGNEKTIIKLFKTIPNNVKIINNSSILHKTANPRDALRLDTSMLQAFQLLSEENADGILSSGDSGSYVILATLKVSRINGISRPAFMPIMPSIVNKHFLLLDVGANIEIKSNYLVEWFKIANEYYKIIFNREINSFGILNIGTEDYKGLEASKEARETLKLNNKFVGFVEPKDLINGNVDIALSDGYAGNIFLKTMESSFLGVGSYLKKIIRKNLKTKIGGLLLKKELNQFKKTFDYRNVGGAFIIGLNKIVVKAHGGSDEIAFYSALKQIKNAIENNIIEKLNTTFLMGEENGE
ncbi:phosphate acyltransferase PlsX [Metamycoplasma buccale]|uniref:phosphate acyltransferase PlsX n=1 Tax=Metamycoplasma buccale TaxID=55602 RepID=UPI00398E9F0C